MADEAALKVQDRQRQTLEARLVAVGYRPSGFDYLRIILSTAVIVTHSINVSYGPAATFAFWTPSLRPAAAVVLAMFFALSGFLVASSLERCRTTGGFLALRVLRIVPALAVEITLSALVIGLFFTTVPLREYFSDPLFARYMLNILGIVHFYLPGVFADNPWPRLVNGQLWTLPYELYCYATLAVLFAFGTYRTRWRFLAIVVAINIGMFIWYWGIRKTQIGITLNGPLLVVCFLYGIALYQHRSRVPWNAALFALSVLVCYGCLRFEIGNYLAPLPAAYATIYLGLLQPKRNWLVSSGDYSYGLFLYGYPIQQAVVAMMGPAGQHWWVNVLVAWPLAFLCAFVSWHFVEARAMWLKPRIMAWDAAQGARVAAAGSIGPVLGGVLVRFRGLPMRWRAGTAALLVLATAATAFALMRRKPEIDFPLVARLAVINAHLDEAAKGYILIAGDSNAEMVNPAFGMCGRELVNAGIAGAKVADYVERWRRINFTHRPAGVLLAIGTNDLHRKRDPLRPTYLANFERHAETLVQQAMEVSDAVFVLAVPPAERTMTVYEPGAVVAFSQRLQSICQRVGCTYLDPFAEAREGNSGLARPGGTRDGIHIPSYRKAMAGIEPQVCARIR